jgi:cystathionine beta-lyase/cystathionine gamma-synthase
MTYSTGLAAFHAIMVLLNPKRVFIGDGYHGVHGNIDLMTKLTGVEKLPLEQLDQLGPGDIVHIETPLNPTGEARNLSYYSAKARAAGAFLTVDATFAPPPLQYPLQFGADIVLHSGTKYIGGHSDMMCGILVVHPERVRQGWIDQLYSARLVMGNVMGNLEGWLGLRSLRTLELRVKRQSENAESLVRWIDEEIQNPCSVVGQVVDSIRHASLQKEDVEDGWLKRQMAGGFGPVFAIWLKTPDQAKRFPSKLHIFQHATSLGDVESLIEWRAMSDSKCDTKLLRISCGVEDAGDLKRDLLQGFQALCE